MWGEGDVLRVAGEVGRGSRWKEMFLGQHVWREVGDKERGVECVGGKSVEGMRRG